MPTSTFLQRVRSGLSRAVSNTVARLMPARLQIRRFQGAQLGRLASDWVTTEQSINQELRGDLNRLRARGRDLRHNNDYAAKFTRMVTSNIIGPGGIRLQVRVEDSPGKPDRAANAAIEAAWKEWASACDISGQQSLRDLCNTIVGGLPSDGEFCVRMVVGADAGNRFGFALQVIDVDRIDTTYNLSATGSTNAVIMGVEVDAYRRPVALHLFTGHPSDGTSTSRTRVRVPTTEVLHRFKVERAEQLRGIPWMAPGMLSLHHLGGFMLSAVLAAEHGANHYGFFTSAEAQAPIGSPESPEPGAPIITTSQPGVYDTLPSGVTFTPHESKYPNEVFGPFVKTALQRVASGWSVAYHSVGNDLEGVSYSSIRSGALEERDRWMDDQEWFINVFMEPVYRKWLSTSLLMGAITFPNGNALPYSKLAKFSRHEWQARRWEWVDPKGDMEAKILAVKAGLMSPQDLCAAMGYDFEDTVDAIAMAMKLAAEVGVQLTAYDGTPGATSAAPAAEPVAAKSQSTKDAEPVLHELLRTLVAGQRAPAATPPVALAVDVTASAMDAAITKAAAPYFEKFESTARAVMEREMQVNIQVPEQPAPVVNVSVAAPNVTLEASVPQAQVHVIQSHPKRAVQTVQHDADGEIVSTVTQYES